MFQEQTNKWNWLRQHGPSCWHERLGLNIIDSFGCRHECRIETKWLVEFIIPGIERSGWPHCVHICGPWGLLREVSVPRSRSHRRETVNELTRPFSPSVPTVIIVLSLFHYLSYSLLPCGRPPARAKTVFSISRPASIPIATVLTNFITVLLPPLRRSNPLLNGFLIYLQQSTHIFVLQWLGKFYWNMFPLQFLSVD